MSEDSTQELPQLVEVHVSTPDPESAQRIAADLVARQLAVCVQVLGPMASVYSWKGVVQRSQEYLLLAKTTAQAFPRVAEVVRHQHPYDIPEVIAVPISHALAEYGRWVRKHSDGIDDEELLVRRE
ncbi:MAG: divalent-cation tolerance protein CutA [Ornithinimicrobium sp.]|uniref:divalent-cation tolerance protein CutA n=1 Tax=Ornithinimicrobium sp. TaxID=1977084 RepID=UPI0026DF3389|nr:divalent-cation tolerance protein CutA [Ornithinimicrobium sp.]MDO5741113.1 divalent-cation tolerance protein CutA [Ornithinimicrobium sp.]